MEQIESTLFSRLSSKGLGPEQIAGLIRDVGNAIEDNENISAPMVNRKLAYLGWEEEMIDECTFQLILPILEQNGKKPELFPQAGRHPESKEI
ncbi:MAG: hypothetical protein R6U13_14375 [Desulfatiglandaceae bacterium]